MFVIINFGDSMDSKRIMKCKVYQVSPKKGTLNKNELYNKVDGGINYDINEIDDIIVYRPSIFKPNVVKEVLTDIEFDFIERVKVVSPLGTASTFEIVGGKDVLDTFVALPWQVKTQKELNSVQLRQYIEKHFNVDEYRRQLMSIKSIGFKNRMLKELSESELSEEEKMKDIFVKMKKLKRSGFNSLGK